MPIALTQKQALDNIVADIRKQPEALTRREASEPE